MKQCVKLNSGVLESHDIVDTVPKAAGKPYILTHQSYYVMNVGIITLIFILSFSSVAASL